MLPPSEKAESGKKLGWDTVRTADLSWPKWYSVPHNTILSNRLGGFSFKCSHCWSLAGHQSPEWESGCVFFTYFFSHIFFTYLTVLILTHKLLPFIFCFFYSVPSLLMESEGVDVCGSFWMRWTDNRCVRWNTTILKNSGHVFTTCKNILRNISSKVSNTSSLASWKRWFGYLKVCCVLFRQYLLYCMQ